MEENVYDVIDKEDINIEEDNEIENIEIFDTFEEYPTTLKTQKNINKCLYNSLKKYGINDRKDERIANILKIHGLEESQFDILKNMENLVLGRVEDESIDSNSNRNERNVESLVQETLNPYKKLLGYDFLYQTLKEDYNKQEANRLMGLLYDYSLGLNDSTKILIPYCWSFDATKLVIEGRQFGQLKSAIPKRIDSYIASLCETIHQLSNNLAGAIAIGTIFLDISHILIYREKVSYLKLKFNRKLRKRIQNELQQFIHSINHLSRSGAESPFTNISIFDEEKIKNLISKDNYYWYFNEKIKDKLSIINKEKYLINYIMELQKIYIELFDKGDPLSNGMLYRYPVTTVNLSKTKEDKLINSKFLKYYLKKDIVKYNNFASIGNKISSCCRLINNYDMISLASQSNSFGAGSSISLGSHRVVTINFNRIALECKDYNDFYNILKNRIIDVAKILKSHKRLLKQTVKNDLQFFIKIGWINLNKMFSTYGILGLIEAEKTLIKRFDLNKGIDYKKDMLMFFNNEVNILQNEYNKDKIFFNIEQIPAESMAYRFKNADKILFNKQVQDEIYANQFVPLTEETSIWHRMKEYGKYNNLLTGGGIVHINLDEELTHKQKLQILEYAVEVGCEHFAINPIISKCINEHYNKGKYDICPICNSKIENYFTRVVGYFTPVNFWHKERREEFNNRYFTNFEKK